MNVIAKNSRLPLFFVALALAVSALLGAYFFWRPAPDTGNLQGEEVSQQASSGADVAVAAAGMSNEERKATEAVVRAYILDNPEIITEAVAILQQRETAKRLTSVQKEIATPFPGAEAGNPKGDITLVEFTDYSCGFCRASVADVKRLLTEDRQIRLIYRELPILSPASREAAAWALAAARQGKHQAFHDAMFAAGPPSAQNIRTAASKAGLNLPEAEAFTVSQAVKTEIESNLSIMQHVGFNGTPTFVIDNQIFEGALGYDALKAAVKKARDRG